MTILLIDEIINYKSLFKLVIVVVIEIFNIFQLVFTIKRIKRSWKVKWNMNKKRLIIILAVLLVVCCIILLTFYIINKKKKDDQEAIKILEKYCEMQVFLELDNNDIDKIKNKIENIENVKSVEVISGEDAVNTMKDKFGDEIMKDFDVKRLPISLYIRVKLDSVDDYRTVPSRIKNEVSKIEGVDKISGAKEGFVEVDSVYQKTGIMGLKAYDMIINMRSEQGQDAVNNYLNEHKKIKKLLKEFI